MRRYSFRLLFLFSILVGLVMTLFIVNTSDACSLKDANGRTFGWDCYNRAILRVREDQYIDVTVTKTGFWNTYTYLNQYHEGPVCAGPAYQLSYTKTWGQFFEDVQFIDERFFYFASQQGPEVTGDRIGSISDLTNSWCYTIEWAYDAGFIFTLTETKEYKVAYKLQTPFGIATVK